MPPIAKKYKVKSNSDVSDKSISESPAKKTVVSGQLQKSIANKRKARKGKFKSQRGVVYVKNLPHGFFEEQLQKYFQQFGRVTKVRLARSTRTGTSKGFAFIEFEVPEVAEIAAETMNNYLMFRKIVKATYIPPNEQKYNFFKTSVRKVRNKFGKEIFVSCKTRAANRTVRQMNNWSDENYEKRVKKSKRKLNALKRKYAEFDVDLDACVLGPDGSVAKEESSNAEKSDQSGTHSPVKKKQKTASNGDASVSSGVDSTPAKSTPSTKSEKSSTSQKENQKLKKHSSGGVTIEHLLHTTIEDDSSGDEDFIPDDKFISDDDTLHDEDDEESENEDEELSEQKSSSKGSSNGKETTLHRLMEDTIEEDDSSDDDFDPEEESESNSASESDEDSPTEVSKKKTPNAQSKLEKISQRKPLQGGIQKKGKVQKPVKSTALRQKIQESVKAMVKQKQIAPVKGKVGKKAKKRSV